MSGLEVSVSRLLAWCDLVSLDYTGVRLCHEAEARLGQWWTEGHGLCAIIARFRPDLLQYHSLGNTNKWKELKVKMRKNLKNSYLSIVSDKSKASDNLKIAHSVAETHLNIPTPDKLTSEDGELDQPRVMQYLAR